ncbi:MAG: hypothetical protein KAH09_01200 [Desulfobacula sp.]|nr:hypothetical protein [Desulfobacula sp.]
MNDPIKEDWYYIIVENPGTSGEKFVGYADKEIDINFIPAFKTKEISQQCFLLLPKDIMNNKYEIHAVIKDDLLNQAAETGHKIYLLDEKGRILKHLN